MAVEPGKTAPNGDTGDTVIAKGKNGFILTKGMVYKANAPFDLSKKGYFTKGDVMTKASGYTQAVTAALNTSDTTVAQVPSETKKDLNKASTELSDAKKRNGDTITVDNSQKTIQVGNKPNPRILMAENKPDYPAFMQPQ